MYDKDNVCCCQAHHLIQALRELGGSGTIEEIAAKTAEIIGLTDEQLEVFHDPEKGSQTEFEYGLAWTRTYLKKYGVLENSTRGVWALTQKGRQLDSVNPKTVKRCVTWLIADNRPLPTWSQRAGQHRLTGLITFAIDYFG